MARKLSRRAIARYAAAQLHAGASLAELARSIAAYLVQHRRTKELSTLIGDIQFELAAQGIIVGTSTTALELEAEVQRSLEVFVQNRTGAQTVHLEPIVDTDVLGGVRISLPGSQLDRTIAHSLTTLTTRYKKA